MKLVRRASLPSQLVEPACRASLSSQLVEPACRASLSSQLAEPACRASFASVCTMLLAWPARQSSLWSAQWTDSTSSLCKRAFTVFRGVFKYAFVCVLCSMIGCGLIQVHYAFHNISQNSATTIKYFTKMLRYLLHHWWLQQLQPWLSDQQYLHVCLN